MLDIRYIIVYSMAVGERDKPEREKTMTRNEKTAQVYKRVREAYLAGKTDYDGAVNLLVLGGLKKCNAKTEVNEWEWNRRMPEVIRLSNLV